MYKWKKMTLKEGKRRTRTCMSKSPFHFQPIKRNRQYNLTHFFLHYPFPPSTRKTSLPSSSVVLVREGGRSFCWAGDLNVNNIINQDLSRLAVLLSRDLQSFRVSSIGIPLLNTKSFFLSSFQFMLKFSLISFRNMRHCIVRPFLVNEYTVSHRKSAWNKIFSVDLLNFYFSTISLYFLGKLRLTRVTQILTVLNLSNLRSLTDYWKSE